ncbi:hypothetical protein HPB47_004044 [Ixodes persulcatus]|uniref:Uncharacterized protein n=1 Tax=Ixodes persulcatus TaxID=34615 RepID=A0AC60PHA5_IXOPE|nr:hypothetical protein HPB47_004044 [Ixodes persulcatus]
MQTIRPKFLGRRESSTPVEELQDYDRDNNYVDSLAERPPPPSPAWERDFPASRGTLDPHGLSQADPPGKIRNPSRRKSMASPAHPYLPESNPEETPAKKVILVYTVPDEELQAYSAYKRELPNLTEYMKNKAAFLEFQQNQAAIAEYVQNRAVTAEYEQNKAAITEYMQNRAAFQEYKRQNSTGNSSASCSEVLSGSSSAGASQQHIASMDEDREQETGAARPWYQMRRRGKRQRYNEISDSTPSTPNYTAVLKPICREDVFNIGTKNIRDAITRTSFDDKECSVHVNEKSNTIAIKTRNQQVVDKLLTIGTIEQKGKALEMKPYVATSSALSKEVIYLRGHDNDETPESLMKELECRTHQISAARIIGRSGRTVLITFESQTLPRYVRYACESFKVSSYRPRPLVCHKCHTVGHKADVCLRTPSGAAAAATSTTPPWDASSNLNALTVVVLM